MARTRASGNMNISGWSTEQEIQGLKTACPLSCMFFFTRAHITSDCFWSISEFVNSTHPVVKTSVFVLFRSWPIALQVSFSQVIFSGKVSLVYLQGPNSD